MKKIINLFLLMILSTAPCFSASVQNTDWTEQTNVNRVNKIGTELLSKNNLPTKIKFKVIETDDINAFANSENEICVYTGLLKFVDNDEELAGVIAHEIGHIVNNHVAKQSVISTITTTLIYNAKLNEKLTNVANSANNLTMLKMSRTEEYEADITGVDLITNAGYNPLAMVSVLYKISGNYIDIISTHPSGDKRTMYIYDYITYTYPTQAKAGYTTNSYKQFMIYATPIVEKRNANSKKAEAFNKQQEKLKAKRIKKMNKYKSTTTNGWEKSFNVLKLLSADQQQ